MREFRARKDKIWTVLKNGQISQKLADLIHHFKMNEIRNTIGKNWECVAYVGKSEDG